MASSQPKPLDRKAKRNIQKKNLRKGNPQDHGLCNTDSTTSRATHPTSAAGIAKANVKPRIHLVLRADRMTPSQLQHIDPHQAAHISIFKKDRDEQVGPSCEKQATEKQPAEIKLPIRLADQI